MLKRENIRTGDVIYVSDMSRLHLVISYKGNYFRTINLESMVYEPIFFFESDDHIISMLMQSDK